MKTNDKMSKINTHKLDNESSGDMSHKGQEFEVCIVLLCIVCMARGVPDACIITLKSEYIASLEKSASN